MAQPFCRYSKILVVPWSVSEGQRYDLTLRHILIFVCECDVVFKISEYW